MIIDKSICEFINELKSAAPTPGGGGAAALSSAQGTALIMMVANLTVSNEKYSEWHGLCNEVLDGADKILSELLGGIDADAEAFRKSMSSDATASDLKSAIEVPLSVMRNTDKALALNEKLWKNSNPNLESDLIVSKHNLVAGLLSAKVNIDVNLKGIEKIDGDYATKIKNEANDLVSKWCPGEDSNLRHPL